MKLESSKMKEIVSYVMRKVIHNIQCHLQIKEYELFMPMRFHHYV